MNTGSSLRITPAMERAKRYCEYRFPVYGSGEVDPIRALETGVANCAIRAFAIASFIEESEGPAGIFIHRGSDENTAVYGAPQNRHAVACHNGSAFMTQNPQSIGITPIKPGCGLYKEGMLIDGDPVNGLMEYIRLHPDFEQVPPSNIVEAYKLIQTEAAI